MSTTAQREYGLFVDGEAAEGSESRELVEPATGEPLATVQLAGEADVDRAVAAARAALDGAWGKTPATERSRLLHALADAIVANRKELAELETRNVGKAISSESSRCAATSGDSPRRTVAPAQFLSLPKIPSGVAPIQRWVTIASGCSIS